MSSFQQTFVQEAIYIGYERTPCKCGLIVNGQAADQIAKGPSLNFKIFSGKFGCSYCLHPGQRLPGRGNVGIYLPGKCSARNHMDSLCHAELATLTGKSLFELRGRSFVHEILQIPEML